MKKITFEKAYEELQGILNQLQEETISIDDLAQKTRRAAELIKYCQTILRNTEEALEDILDNDG